MNQWIREILKKLIVKKKVEKENKLEINKKMVVIYCKIQINK